MVWLWSNLVTLLPVFFGVAAQEARSKHSVAEQRLRAELEVEVREQNRVAVETLRQTEQSVFDKEAATFRASLKKDIDYVVSMAADFEKKAETALAERRKRLAEDRRTAVQRLYVHDVFRMVYVIYYTCAH